MSKYTPEVTSGGYTGKIVDENGDTVAIVNNYEQAILMASAPELLEALKEIVSLGEGMLDPTRELDIARQAITKAEHKP